MDKIDKVIRDLPENYDFPEEVYKINHTIVYQQDKQDRNRIVCHCSQCGEFEAEYVERHIAPKCTRCYGVSSLHYRFRVYERIYSDGDSVQCPICGAECRVFHHSSLKVFNKRGRPYAYSMARTLNNVDDTAVMLTWVIDEYIDVNGSHVFFERPFIAYIFDDKKVYKAVKGQQGCSYYSTYLSRYVTWKRLKATPNLRSEDFLKMMPTYYESENVFDGTALENAKVVEYLKETGRSPERYARLYQFHNRVENLVMQGYAPMINYELNKDIAVSKLMKYVNWKVRKPHEMLGLTKEQFKLYTDFNTGYFNIGNLQALAVASGKWDLTRDEVEYCFAKLSAEQMRDIQIHPVKVVKKLIEQKKDFSTLRDTWEMSGRVWLPKSISRAHDTALAEYETKKNALVDLNIQKRAEKLSKYAFEADGYIIRPVSGYAELAEEGRKLHHCVASYGQRIADGNTNIFLVRKETAPDVPLYTLEYNNEHIVQCRTLRNASYEKNDEVYHFTQKWLGFIDKKGGLRA